MRLEEKAEDKKGKNRFPNFKNEFEVVRFNNMNI